jgi:hypothetical protein
MKIAVDFDGTIVEHKFPEIGKIRPFAFQTLKMLQEKGDLLILWTYRYGRYLDEAIELCRENGVEFYAINSNHPDEVFHEGMSRKIDCDYYIDDRNIGGLPSWGEIYQMLYPNDDALMEHRKPKKKSFWRI